MRLEAVRMMADWLGNATYGVNAKLVLLTPDSGDTIPGAVATIADETRNVNVAFNRPDGLTLPALLVTSKETTFRDGELLQPNARSEGTVTISVRYAARVSDGAVALADGAYACRAVVASIRELNANAQAASRLRNNIQLTSCNTLRLIEKYEEVQDTWLLESVEAEYYVCDLKPLGA